MQCANLQLIPCIPHYLRICEHNMLTQTSVNTWHFLSGSASSPHPLVYLGNLSHLHVFVIESKSYPLNVAFSEFPGIGIDSFFYISIAPFIYVHFTNLWLFIYISVSPLRPWGQTCKYVSMVPQGSTGCFHLIMLAKCLVETSRNATPCRNLRKYTLRKGCLQEELVILV